MRRGALVLLPFGVIRTLGGGATSRWRPNATWWGANATWRTRFPPFWAVLTPLRRSHVVLEVQRDMVGGQCDVAGPHTILHRLFSRPSKAKKATSELGQRWRALRLFGFLFA